MNFITLLLIFTLFSTSCSNFGQKEKLDKAPAPVTQQLQVAQTQYKNQQYEQAIKTLKSILQFHRNTEVGDDALYLLAQVYSRTENWESAIGTYRAIYDSDYYSSREILARLATARILTYKVGGYKQALRLIDQSLRLNLNREQKIDLIEIRFTCLMKSGAQLEAFETLVQLSKEHPSASKRENFKRKAKAFLDSRLTGPNLKDFANDSPQSELKIDAMYRYGIYLMGQGNYKEARSYFEKVISFSPKSYTGLQAKQLIEQLSARSVVNQRTVGVVLPLSGRYSNIGYQALWGLQLALGIKGGKNSTNLRLAVVDSRGKAEQARKAIRRLVEEDHAIAIVGGLLGKTAYAAAIQAQEIGVPFIAMSQKEGLTDIGHYIFRNSLTINSQLDQVIKTAMDDLNLKKFAILYPNDKYGVSISQNFWNKVKSKGGQVTGVQTYSPGETDFKEPIQKLVGTFYTEDRENEYATRLKEWMENIPESLRKRKKPPIGLLPPIVDFDALFIPDSPKAVGQIAPMLAYNDVNNIYLIGTNIWNSNEFLRRGQSFVSKSLFADGLYGKDQSFIHSPFYQSFTQTFNKVPSNFSLMGYDTGLILRSVIASNVDSRLEFTQFLKQNKGIPGALSTLYLNTKKEFIRPIVTLTVDRGQITPYGYEWPAEDEKTN